jgi:DnaJ-class molecular chaperone
MAKDYYKILGINYPASDEVIKSAYRAMALKWHPDHNPGRDATRIMEDINEAYFLLRDPERKKAYDNEYQVFHQSDNTFDFGNYEYQNEDLKRDVDTASKEASDFVADFFKSLKADAKSAAKGAWDEMKIYLIIAGIFAIIGLIVIAQS